MVVAIARVHAPKRDRYGGVGELWQSWRELWESTLIYMLFCTQLRLRRAPISE